MKTQAIQSNRIERISIKSPHFVKKIHQSTAAEVYLKTSTLQEHSFGGIFKIFNHQKHLQKVL